MEKVAILCICTGPYATFWNMFFESFEHNFLPSTEKHYYIFSDAEQLCKMDNERVHATYLEPEPWPLGTLLKYHRFLTIENELSKYEYIYQTNVNMKCIERVDERDFLPHKEDKPLFFTQHFGFYRKKKYYYPYDRNKKSLAYIPYNQGKMYVYGAMNGGRAKEYILFMKELDNRIVEDLAHGVIAKWHDESHVNHYVATHSDYEILSSDYCYPEESNMPQSTKIMAIDKKNFFNVGAFKNGGEEIQSKITIMYRIKCKLNPIYMAVSVKTKYYLDLILNKKIAT